MIIIRYLLIVSIEYPISFLAHKDDLEKHLYTTQKAIFEYDETRTLYDLTNTYFEGGVEGVEKAKRGRSKEKEVMLKSLL
ncbi:MAG: hypothetical protein Q9M43_13570 [Sulfurimonas sp.]|nr:hypothetical protein [Sulfurimonas sp.]